MLSSPRGKCQRFQEPQFPQCHGIPITRSNGKNTQGNDLKSINNFSYKEISQVFFSISFSSGQPESHGESLQNQPTIVRLA